MPTDSALATPDNLPAEVPDYVIAHLSDTHLPTAGTLYNGKIDADAALAKAVEQLQRALDGGQRIDAIVASGDLTDTGDPQAYSRLRDALEPLEIPLIYATGNHDVRTAFHRSLLGLDHEDPMVQEAWLCERLRFLVLDSTVVGAGNGRLSAETLAKLRKELSKAAPDGTVVVLHHAPIPPPTPLLVYFSLERASREALAGAIRGTDVRIVLAGHHHLAQSGTLGGVPVAVAGSTAIRTDPMARPGWERTTRSSSFNLIRIYPDTLTVSVIPVDGADEVFNLDPDGCAEVIRRFPAR